jgi:hypothetical protein
LHLLLDALHYEFSQYSLLTQTATHFANAMQFFFSPKEKLTISNQAQIKCAAAFHPQKKDKE